MAPPAPAIYLDNHATTPVDPRVVEAMLPFFTEAFGNASSTSHPFGWRAKEAVEAARVSIAQRLGAAEREIVFTSGATESNNLVLRGLAERPRRKGNHFVSVTTEHKAVLDPLARLARRGCEVTLLSPRAARPAARPGQDAATGQDDPAPDAGRLDVGQVAAALRDDTLLVSVMLANNEIGVLQPIAEIGALCRARGVPLHCDATQAVGKIPVDVAALHVDYLTFSAHKMYGPKGVGGLFARREPRLRLEPQLDGGGQERGQRGGTLNVPGIVGMARALELCVAEMADETRRLRALRDRLWSGLRATVAELALHGPALDRPDLRLPHNLNCGFARVDGEALMMSMRDIAVSSGSACTSANPEPSHVLRALGLTDDQARASLRFGLGRFNTGAEIDRAIDVVSETVKRLRRLGGAAPRG